MSANSLTLCSESDFFKELEKYVNFNIPIQIQNILNLNCYCSAVTMSRFNETSIRDIEHFMRNVFNDSMIEVNSSRRAYLGIFENNQSNFMLLSGQKTLLTIISEYCSALYKSADGEKSVQKPSSSEIIDASLQTVIIESMNINI
jgi:hypothetical protein